MEIKLFKKDTKFMCRLSNDDKDIPACEIFFSVMFLKQDKIKEMLGNKKPVVIVDCEVTEKENKYINRLKLNLNDIYGKKR
jgi:hypothetical protein